MLSAKREAVVKPKNPKFSGNLFQIQTDFFSEAKRLGLVVINKKKKRESNIIDVAVPAEHMEKTKEN